MPARRIIGKLCKVEVATAFAATPIAPATVSVARPAVVGATAHGLANGAVGVFEVITGMVQLNEQAATVVGQTANAYNLQNLSTKGFTPWIANAANIFRVASTWDLLSEAVGYSTSNEAPDVLDDARLHLSKPFAIQGGEAAEVVTLDIAAMTYDEGAGLFVRNAAEDKTSCLFRVTFDDGATRVFFGAPSTPGESVTAEQLGTGSFTVTLAGKIARGANPTL